MTRENYNLFKSTNPRIRSYERVRSLVVIECTCSLEHAKTIERLEKLSKEIRIISKDTCIWFEVESNDKDFTDNLVRDFF